MSNTRRCEVLDKGRFVEIPFPELRKGHVYRLFEDDGTPESDGQICQALSDVREGRVRCEPMSMVELSDKKFVKDINIDFDGVIHDHEGGWKGKDVVAGNPVKGAFAWLGELLDDDDFEPVVYSSRSDEPVGIKAMRDWFELHGFERVNELEFPTQKPPAWLTVDDRCFLFKGLFPSLREMAEFRPWNR